MYIPNVCGTGMYAVATDGIQEFSLEAGADFPTNKAEYIYG
jgi:hypothetical protein